MRAENDTSNNLTGRVTMEMMQKCEIPGTLDTDLILVCGPNSFNEEINKLLIENKYKPGINVLI